MGLTKICVLFALVALAAAKKPVSPDNVVPELLLQELRDDMGDLEVSALKTAIKEHGEHSMSPHTIRRILAGVREQAAMLGTNDPVVDRVMDHGEATRYDIVRNGGAGEPIWAVCDCGALCFNFILGGSEVCDTIGDALDESLRIENDTRHVKPCVYASDHLNETEDPKCQDYDTSGGREASVMEPLEENTPEDGATGSTPDDTSTAGADVTYAESEALKHALDTVTDEGEGEGTVDGDVATTEDGSP